MGRGRVSAFEATPVAPPPVAPPPVAAPRVAAPGETTDYVTFTVADQLFGLPIRAVHDVLTLPELTPVPLARPDFAGLVNMRGRVVTAIDLRSRLGLPGAAARPGRMAIGIEAGADSFGLIVDTIGEIVRVDTRAQEVAVHLGDVWTSLSSGIHRVGDAFLVVLDLAAVLDIGPPELDTPTHPRIRVT